MATDKVNMSARPPAANVNMADLADWWTDISATHGVRVRVTWELTGSDELALWRFCVTAYKPLSNTPNEVWCEKSLVWPTASHRTVLGALLWLLMTIDDDLSADAALATMRSAGL